MMKATNYQKQQLRMHEIKFSSDVSFDEAKKMIENKERKIEKARTWMKGNGLEGSSLFDRWLEDDKPTKRKKKQ